MADFWIRVHANLANKPVAFRAAEALHVKRAAAIGHLVMFWGAVSQHAQDGHVADYPNAQLESWACWEGARGAFAKFVREQHLDADGRVSEWDEYGGALQKAREKNRQRIERWRASQEHRSNAAVTVTETATLPKSNGITKRNETKRNEEDQKRVGDKRPPAPEWVAPAIAQWSAQVGHTTPTKVTRALGPLVTAHGWEAVSRGLSDYLIATPLSKAKLEWFAERGTYWVTLSAQDLVDPVTCEKTERHRVVIDGRAA